MSAENTKESFDNTTSILSAEPPVQAIADDNNAEYTRELTDANVLNGDFANSIFGSEAISTHFSRTSANGDVEDEEKVLDGALPDNKSVFSQKRLGFFSSGVSDIRRKVIFLFVRNWLIISTFMLMIFSIYWGAIYNRPSKYHNFKFMVVNEDLQQNNISPLIGQSVVDYSQSSAIKYYGTYEIYNTQNFTEKYRSLRHTTNDDGSFNVTKAIHILVHQQHTWGVVHIQPNTTFSLYSALTQSNSSFSFLQSVPINFFYETGRDFLSMSSIVVPIIEIFSSEFNPAYVTKTIMNPLINLLTSEEKSNLVSNASDLISNVPNISLYDFFPVTNSTLFAPMQVGMIYLIIITFFNFNFFSSVHQIIAPHLKISHFIIYRIVSAQFSYFILSLPMSLVSLAFQIDFTVTYGRAGFFIFWMTNYLTMSAVGGANENMAMLIFPVFPPLLGFWLLSWVVMNISTAFFTFVTMSNFYRFGYFFPLHNSYNIMSVILTNSYKGNLGRNYGILVAWVVVNIAFAPFCMKFFASRMAKNAAAEKSKN